MNLGITNSTEFRNIVTKNDSSVWEKNHRIYLEGDSNRIWSLVVGKGYKETVPTWDSVSYSRWKFSSGVRFPDLPAGSGAVRFFERFDWSNSGCWDYIAVSARGTQFWYHSFSY
jgi:hypothetical protein